MANCGGAAPQRGAGVGRVRRAGDHHRGAGDVCHDAVTMPPRKGREGNSCQLSVCLVISEQ